MKKKIKMMSNIFFVWYNKNIFIFNNSVYPFLHNFEYLSQFNNVYLLYFIEDENIKIKEKKNYFNFKKVFSEYKNAIETIKGLTNKIDLMKIILLQNFNKLVNCDNIILMDFDCNISDIQPIKYDIEPFFDDNCIYLISLDLQNELDSYIENYATRINLKGLEWLKENFKINNLNLEHNNLNSYIYNIYVHLIIKYFSENLNFNFLKIISNRNVIKITNTCKIKFSRGASWREDSYDLIKNQIYIYDKNIKPIYYYEYEKLKTYIYENNIDKVIKKVNSFKKRNYDFNNNFHWCTSLQRYGTLLEFLEDKFNKENLFKIINEIML